jgi:hypothetical protein
MPKPTPPPPAPAPKPSGKAFRLPDGRTLHVTVERPKEKENENGSNG